MSCRRRSTTSKSSPTYSHENIANHTLVFKSKDYCSLDDNMKTLSTNDP